MSYNNNDHRGDQPWNREAGGRGGYRRGGGGGSSGGGDQSSWNSREGGNRPWRGGRGGGHHSNSGGYSSNPRWNPNRDDQSAGGVGGGVGGGGGVTRPKDDSYGVVLLSRINDQWYGLFQVSLSAAKGDFKIDPLRGKRNSKRDSTLDTAIREVFDESCFTIDLGALVCASERVHYDGAQQLYYCKANWHSSSAATASPLTELMNTYDEHLVQEWKRFISLDTAKLPSALDCVGIVWVPIPEPGATPASETNGVRHAFQTIKVLETLQRLLIAETFPIQTLALTSISTPFSSQRSKFVVATAQGGAPQNHSVDGEWQFTRSCNHLDDASIRWFHWVTITRHPEDLYQVIVDRLKENYGESWRELLGQRPSAPPSWVSAFEQQ